MQLVVRQQLDAPREIFLQHLDREAVARALVRRDIVQSLLEREPVQRRRPIRIELVEYLSHTLLSRRRLQIAVMLDRPHHGHCGTGCVRSHDQPDAVRQLCIRHRNKGRRHLQLAQLLFSPVRQHHRFGRRRRHLLAPAKSLLRDRLAIRRRLQRRRNRRRIQQILLRHPIHIRQRDLLHRVDVFVGRVAALARQRFGPHRRQVRNGVALELRLRNLRPLRRVHQIGRHTVGRVFVHDLPHLVESRIRILPRGQRHNPKSDTRLRIRFRETELRRQRLARRHHAIQIRALARQHIGENLHRRTIRRIRPRHPPRDEPQDVRQIAVQRERLRLSPAAA